MKRFGQRYCIPLILKERKHELPLDVPWEEEFACLPLFSTLNNKRGACLEREKTGNIFLIALKRMINTILISQTDSPEMVCVGRPQRQKATLQKETEAQMKQGEITYYEP